MGRKDEDEDEDGEAGGNLVVPSSTSPPSSDNENESGPSYRTCQEGVFLSTFLRSPLFPNCLGRLEIKPADKNAFAEPAKLEGLDVGGAEENFQAKGRFSKTMVSLGAWRAPRVPRGPEEALVEGPRVALASRAPPRSQPAYVGSEEEETGHDATAALITLVVAHMLNVHPVMPAAAALPPPSVGRMAEGACQRGAARYQYPEEASRLTSRYYSQGSPL
ncbi:hypothetical protein KM043_008773 [Ampulex compressa]|nr:hypothetical protein KM043_008773 [Ampulex compressa]